MELIAAAVKDISRIWDGNTCTWTGLSFYTEHILRMVGLDVLLKLHDANLFQYL